MPVGYAVLPTPVQAVVLFARLCRVRNWWPTWKLSRGIALQISIVSKADDPILYLERRAYLDALHATLRGVEAARVVLVKARQRLDSTER